MGRKLNSTFEITIWEPYNMYAQRVVIGPVPFEYTVILESRQNDTEVTFAGHAAFRGLFKLAEPLVRKRLEKQIDADNARLKRVLEEGKA